jgi:hypothetical protein
MSEPIDPLKQIEGNPALGVATKAVLAAAGLTESGCDKAVGNLLFTVATTPAASVALSDAALNELQSGNLALYTHYDWDFQISSTSLEDLSTGDLYVGVKHLDTDTDAEALVLIERTAGLLYINQAAATTAGNATLVVTGTAGAWLITGHLAAVESGKLTAWKRRQLAEVKLGEKLIWTGHITISLGVVQS